MLTELFQNSFGPFTVSNWNRLDPDIRNVNSYFLFRKNLESSIRSIMELNSLIDRGFSHNLHELKFRHNFADVINPLLPCYAEIESTEHYFLFLLPKLCHIRETLKNELTLRVAY